MPRKGVAIPKFDLESIWDALGFRPHDGQREVYEGWRVHGVTTAVMGTRWGKSELASHLPLAHIAPCSRDVITDGRKVRVDHHTVGAVIAPTYDLTGIVMGRLYTNIIRLCRILGYPTKGRTRTLDEGKVDDDLIPGLPELQPEPNTLTTRKVNGHIITIITPWGSRIDAFTMQDPRRLLGRAFDWIVTDESGQFTEKDWSNYWEYVARARVDRDAWVYHGTTPRGFNDLYFRFFEPGQPGPKRMPDYISFQQPTHRNTTLDPEVLAREERETPGRIWRRNYLAEFTVLDGQVWEEFSRARHVREFQPSPDWLYALGLDYGYSDPFVAVLGAWTGEEFVLIAEVYRTGTDATEQKRLITAMLDEHLPPGAMWLDARTGEWTAWGDPRGPAYRAELARVGVRVRRARVRFKGQTVEIEPGAQVVGTYMHPVSGRPYPGFVRKPGDDDNAPRLFTHPRCTNVIHSIESWVRKGDTYSGPDHGADAIRYLIVSARNYAPPPEKMPRRRAPVRQEAPNRTIPTRALRAKSGAAVGLGRR